MQNDKQQGFLFLFFSVEKKKRYISKLPSLRIEALLSWTKSTALSITKKNGAAFFSFASLSLKQLLNRLSHISKLSLSLTHTYTERHKRKHKWLHCPFPVLHTEA